MLLMLLWLTVCLPYVTESNQNLRDQIQLSGEEAPDSSNTNPLNGTNEEKSESETSLLSEYLSHAFLLEHPRYCITRLFKLHPSALYRAYHPERIIPPPEA